LVIWTENPFTAEPAEAAKKFKRKVFLCDLCVLGGEMV